MKTKKMNERINNSRMRGKEGKQKKRMNEIKK